ncbi:MAG TPA: hypothetical protein PK566_15315 [Pseudobacteroides sp.]|jgi:hypothetical protein|nr:hypothetical protein [Pseudobacteroides sp.]
MLYEEMFEVVKNLEFDKHKFTYGVGDTNISIFRPSKLSARFKNYDVNKNFQIFLHEGTRSFRPNHLRVMIDLNLRVRCRPDLKKNLLYAVDKVFYGDDPDKYIEALRCEKFEHYLNDIGIILNLSQLFIIEQNYGYHRESNYDPPTLFYQGWVREFIDSPKEIDNLCMSVCKPQPPSAKYTSKENKKNSKYLSNLPELWYMQEE